MGISSKGLSTLDMRDQHRIPTNGDPESSNQHVDQEELRYENTHFEL